MVQHLHNETAGSLWDFIKTGRLRGTLFVFFFALAGFALFPPIAWAPALSSASSMSLIHMFIMGFNDYIDRDHDIKKNRRLAHEHAGRFRVYLSGLLALTLSGIVVTATTNLAVGGWLAIVLTAGTAYSFFPRLFAINNIVVSACGASPIVCGMLQAHVSRPRWHLYFIFSLVILAREIIKDFEDIEIDSGYKATLPLCLGLTDAKLAACVALIGAFSTNQCAGRETAGIWLAPEQGAISACTVLLASWEPSSQPARMIIIFDITLALLLLMVFLSTV